eukprot:3454793-Prymnesium_polylepis.1
MSKARALRRSHVASPGSEMKAMTSRLAESTARSISLKAAFVWPPANQRTNGSAWSSRHTFHGDQSPCHRMAAAEAACQPAHWSLLRRVSHAQRLPSNQCSACCAMGLQKAAGDASTCSAMAL